MLGFRGSNHCTLAVALTMGCAHPACESAVQELPADDAPESAETPGCRFAERLLEVDERFGKWPSPNEMATAMNREYQGQVEWLDVDKDPPDDIIVVLEVDPDNVVLRYPVSGPRPGERVICKSSLVVHFEVELRLAEAEVEVSSAAATYGADFSATAPLSAVFAALFASPNGDSYEVSLYMRLDGLAVSGRFKTRDSSYRQAGVFGAR